MIYQHNRILRNHFDDNCDNIASWTNNYNLRQGWKIKW
jgi:hypothetical protein